MLNYNGMSVLVNPNGEGTTGKGSMDLSQDMVDMLIKQQEATQKDVAGISDDNDAEDVAVIHDENDKVVPIGYNVLADDYGTDDELDDADTDGTTLEMMQATGEVIGTSWTSVLKQVVLNYIEERKPMLRLDWLIMNRLVKMPIGNTDAYQWVPICDRIRDELMEKFEEKRIWVNKSLPKGATKVKSLDCLPGWAIAMVLIATGDIKVMDTRGNGSTVGSQRVIFRHYFQNQYSGKKMKDGQYIPKWSGQWQIHNEKNSKTFLYQIMSEIDPNSNTAKEIASFNTALYKADRVLLFNRHDIIFWRNGIWDFSKKAAMAYDDPRFKVEYEQKGNEVICLAKFAVNHPCLPMWGGQKPMKFDENGKCIEPKITEPDGRIWSPMYQMQAPFYMDTEKGKASFDFYIRFMQFTLRGMNGAPNYYFICINGDGTGTNGKGTLGDMIELLMVNKNSMPGCEDLIDAPIVINAAVNELKEEHRLNGTNLPYAKLIRGQEADVAWDGRQGGKQRKTIVTDCALVKNISRSQPITWRDLFELPMTMAWAGGLWSEHNDMPIFADNSASMRRALLVLRFEKCFGVKRPWIKDDYIKRPEVRSWLAWYITVEMPCFEKYDEELAEILQEDADELLKASLTASRFFDYILDYIPLDVMGADLLYEMFLLWCDKQKIREQYRMQLETFVAEMRQYANLKGVPVNFKSGQSRMKIKDYKADMEIPAFEMVGTVFGDSISAGKYCKSVKTSDGRVVAKLDWSYFTRKNSMGNIETKLISNCFERKVSHFEQKIKCELPMEDCTDPEYTIDNWEIREEMKTPGFMDMPDDIKQSVRKQAEQEAKRKSEGKLHTA